MTREPQAGCARWRVPLHIYAFFFAAFALVIFVAHLRYLTLPYYWDELGQFVPAALDLYQRGAWVPQTTIPNVHPPALMAYLALVWKLFGYSIVATRLAMLFLASLAALAAFLLAIELCRGAPGAPAFAAILFLLASPLFYTQSMLAQLDLPAMLLSSWALLLFLQDRRSVAALVCVALVLVKETGVIVPLVLGAWTVVERRRRDALWFALPIVALAAWLAVLWRATGNPFGNAQFTDYNLRFPLHPLRLFAALLRRGFYLGIENFHFIGWAFVAVAWVRSRTFATRAWKIAGSVALAQALVVTILGGAVLDRYLLPVLPVMYSAFASAFAAAGTRWKRTGQALLAAGLVASLFWNPPYPYPYENNLAMVDFVRLQEAAAEFVEREQPGRTVTTAWPLTVALWRPELGYVSHRVAIRPIPDFSPSRLAALAPNSVEVFVLFSRDWDRPWDIRRIPWLRDLCKRFYGYEPQVTGDDVERRFGLRRAAHRERGGQWISVYAKPGTDGSDPILFSRE